MAQNTKRVILFVLAGLLAAGTATAQLNQPDNEAEIGLAYAVGF